VKSLVSGDELVGEGEARHEATLLEPEDGGKGAGEKDALYGGKRDEAGAKANVVVDPLEGPGSLLPHARHSLDGAEEVVALLVVLDVGVNEQGVDLGVDVLNGDLKPVEASVVLVLVLVLNQVSQRERKKRERRRKSDLASGIWTSWLNFSTKFSLTMPSEAAKKARTCETKCFSSLESFSQSAWSLERSTSSAVQNEASAFLYICHTSWYWMGNSTKRLGFSFRIASSSSPANSAVFLESLRESWDENESEGITAVAVDDMA